MSLQVSSYYYVVFVILLNICSSAAASNQQVYRWPFMAAILDPSSHRLRCGGIVWNHNTILTADHCLHPDQSYQVYLGHSDINQIDPNYRFDVDKIFKYNQDLIHFSNDIGLIRLDRSIDFNGTHSLASPVKGPEPMNQLDTNRCIAMGWGMSLYNIPNRTFGQLTQIQVSLFKNTRVCTGDTYLCSAADLNGGICEGDSGGPLICPRKGMHNNNWNSFSLAGINSRFCMFVHAHDTDYKKNPCASGDSIVEYTKVIQYTKWIEDSIEKMDKMPSYWKWKNIAIWFAFLVLMFKILLLLFVITKRLLQNK